MPSLLKSFVVLSLIKKTRAFCREERGHIMPLMLFMMLLFLSVLVYLLDTGDAILKKTRLQQAADSAAITQAEWSARSLNVISMNNVAQTQLHTTRIVGASLQTYALVAEAKSWYVNLELVGETARVAKWVADCKNLATPPTVAVCLVVKGAAAGVWTAGLAGPYAWDNNKYRIKVARVRSKYSPFGGYEYSHSAFKAIHAMDDYLLRPTRADDVGKVGFEIAQYHGAENLYTYDGGACPDRKCDDGSAPVGVSMPAQRANFGSTDPKDHFNAVFIAKEFCDASKSGSPNQGSRLGYAGYEGGRGDLGSQARGYSIGRGPWKHSNSKTAFKHVNDTTQIGEYVSELDDLWRNKKWPGFKSIPRAEDPIADQKTFLKQWPPDGTNEQKPDSNAFLEMSDKLDKFYCQTYGYGGAAIDSLGLNNLLALPGLSIPTFGDMSPKPVGLKGMSAATNALGSNASNLIGRFSDPRHLSVFVIARRDGKLKLTDQDEKISVYSYAQAQTYNPAARDLYSQNWRARLVQASFLNGEGCRSRLQGDLLEDLRPPDPKELLDHIRGNAGSGYREFEEIYSSLGADCSKAKDWLNVVVF